MKIGIIGLGPVGMILAVHLKEAGCEVLLCDTDRIKLNLIRSEGIRLENVIEKHERFSNLYGSAAELLNENPDYVFVAIKTYQVSDLLKDVPAGNTSIFISAQNGIDVEHMYAKVLGEHRTCRMVINYAGNLKASNVVRVTFFNPPNYIAPLDDAEKRHAEAIAELLNSVNLTTESVRPFDLTKYTWQKTILNSSLSALCGIGRLTMAEAMAFPDSIELIEQIIVEAVEVAEAEKIRFPDDFVRNCLRYLKKAGHHFPSLAVDLMNNKLTEIDYMNGKIVEYGRKHYVRTSLNLSMVNMVKAMTQKNLITQMNGNTATAGSKINLVHQTGKPKGNCFLGIDLGSSYTKFTLVDEDENVVFRYILKTLNRDKIAAKHIINALHDEFPIAYSCATGYGRKNFVDADIAKTEINCAAVGVNKYLKGEKNILDIGGEDIKLIRCDTDGLVENFYLNDKCAAGTGAFLVEIAERAGIDVKEMSQLASQSDYKQELNSFCTVFAKTEIMKWVFDGLPIENLAKGIYLSIVNRVAKMKIDPGVPIVMIGGVASIHPYLTKMLEHKFNQPVTVLEHPQYTVSLGAALIAKEQFQHVVTTQVLTRTEQQEV
ncbi:MAG: 2-dehydropantoate 2-reductase [Chlorobi bacterium]|nr:MAG: 2-dehydropantoate 2-reductase [Bacteroidota bacterium]MBE2265980.1 2-dehydropantoate 2-reductase [Flavobacteriales bacterium]MBL1161422.1 2-dehydropantoate 2-reductase [Chlorobiota bacterium]MBW7854021.1 2-dehydropantoate 2-reductase [Candidatus Kapabacteria bacterium]MCC6331906.1 2-dehydropantoate 2-reductase [Ignavibacteria bacterium]